jgi:hypothetical protein
MPVSIFEASGVRLMAHALHGRKGLFAVSHEPTGMGLPPPLFKPFASVEEAINNAKEVMTPEIIRQIQMCSVKCPILNK